MSEALQDLRAAVHRAFDAFDTLQLVYGDTEEIAALGEDPAAPALEDVHATLLEQAKLIATGHAMLKQLANGLHALGADELAGLCHDYVEYPSGERYTDMAAMLNQADLHGLFSAQASTLRAAAQALESSKGAVRRGRDLVGALE